MFPSDHRLLQSGRNALRRAIAGRLEPAVAASLAGANVLIDELLMRTDAAWLDAYAAQAEVLVHEGEALLARNPGLRLTGNVAVDPPGASGGTGEHAQRTEALKVALTQLVVALGTGESRDDVVKSYLI